MQNLFNEREQYYKLVKHNASQHIIFNLILISVFILSFVLILPFIQYLVLENYLQGDVYNDGREMPYSIDEKKNFQKTDYLTSWAIDIFKGTSNEARYWFNPIISLFAPLSLFSFWFTLVISSLLPIKIGLIRHKIEREIINQLDKIHYSIYGYYSDERNKELEEQILNAEPRDIHSIAEKWKVRTEEVKHLQKAIKWKYSNSIYKLLHPWTGLAFYLRFYFTERYGNTILGMVYIGAAVLIIIIGLRGLKFIPSTQPSLVFFALGLEFSVLMAYAMIVMYSKSESDDEYEVRMQENKSTFEKLNSKDIENLLRVFIKKPNSKSENKN